MKKEIVAVVPVKGNSERIKHKNTCSFHNTNLFELKLNQLKLVNGFTKVIVSSEDEDILTIANNSGFEIHNRDPKYSTSNIPMSDVYSYIASEISGEHIAWVNVTNPLVGSKIYEKAINEYNVMPVENDCLLSVFKVQDYLYYNNRPVNFKPFPWPRSQDLNGLCAISFAVSILKRKDLADWGSLVGYNPYFFYLDKTASTDIDFQEDFDFCEMIYKKQNP